MKSMEKRRTFKEVPENNSQKQGKGRQISYQEPFDEQLEIFRLKKYILLKAC